MRRLFFAAVIYAFLSVFSGVLFSAAAAALWEGFEDDSSWTNADWKNTMFGTPKITSDYVSEGKRSLEAEFKSEGPGSSGIIQVFDPGDMSGVNEVSIDIYNSSLIPMKVSLMLKTGQNWIYHESPAFSLKPGWNKGIKFKIAGGKFGRDGVFENLIKDPQYVRRFGFLFYAEAKGSGIIFLDNITINGTNTDNLVQKHENAINGENVVIDDFENGRNRWAAASDWSCAVKTDIIKYMGGNSMRAVFDMKTPGQNAVFAIEEGVDLKDAVEITLDVYYPADFPSNMTVAFATGDNWSWQEGPAKRIKKGWNRNITFKLKKNYWKNENSKWNSTVTPADIHDVKRISLVVFPSEMGKGYVLFDNIRIKTADKSKLANLLGSDIAKFTYYPWNSFEKGISGWSGAGQGAVLASPSFNVGGSGKKGMRLNFITSGSQIRPAFSYSGDIDLRTADGIKFDIYNPNKNGIKMSFAVKATESSIWQETKQFMLSPGWNRDVLVDFTKPGFKREETGWADNGYIKHKDDTREIILTFEPGRAMEGHLEMTDIKTASVSYLGETGKYLTAAVETNSGFKAEAVKYNKWAQGCFENGIAGWSAYIENGWGASVISESNKNATEGGKSLLLTGKDIGRKVGVYYNAGSGNINISNYKYIKLDIYNNSKKGKFTVAFKDASNNWTESEEVILNAGWNRNVRIRLDDKKWKTASSYFENVTGIPNKINIKQIILIFSGANESAYYIDNICWGEKASSFAAGEIYTENKISLMFMPADFLDIKAGLNADYYMDKNVSLYFDSLDVYLRGFGNELNIFGGKKVKLFDDVISVIDPEALSSGIMGASLAGTISGSNTEYKAAGINLWTKENWKAGTTYLAGTRIKQYVFGNNYLGGLYFSEKRGYDEGANPFTGAVEQSSHIYGADMSAGMKIAGSGISVKAEYLKTLYDEPQPVYLNGVSYVSETIDSSAPSSLIYGIGEINSGDLVLKVSYRQIDEKFLGSFINQDYKLGTKNEIINTVYIVDNIPPFSVLKTYSEEWAKFVNYTQLMAEYDAMQSSVDTYERRTVTISLKNDQSLALSNYEVYMRYNYEGKNIDPANKQEIDGRVPSVRFNVNTKISPLKELTFGIIGRYEIYSSVIESGAQGLFIMKDGLEKITACLEASYKFTTDIKLKVNYKLSSRYDGIHTNFYSELSGNFYGTLNLALSYGAEPFAGYWKDDLNDDTVDLISLSLRGTF